jgi:metal-responsive CopG/Arc/MetJ family transcriptional regulator
MPTMIRIHVMLGPSQLRALEKLTKKLELDRSALIRLAIARLIEEEEARAKRVQER